MWRSIMAEKKSSAGGADFVAKIVKDPAAPPETLMLNGYLGASSEEGHTRLYFDPHLSNYVEIPNDAILHSQDAGPDHAGLGGSYVWIKRDAELTYGPAGSQRPKGKFLEGPIMQGLGAAGVTANICPTPTAILQCGPTPHAQCPTQVCTPQCPTIVCTASPQCHTMLPPCNISLAPQCHPTVPPQCHPTVAPQCHPTLPLQCQPTLPGPCHPTLPPQCHPTVSPICHPTLPPGCHITLPVCRTEACQPSVEICPSPIPHCGVQTVGPPCVVSGINCPSAVGCAPSLACVPSIACGGGPGGGGIAQQAVTQLGCPTHAPLFCPVTPQCPQTQLGCPTHAPQFCPVTPACPPTQFGHCPTHAPLLCPVTPHCPPTPMVACATHAPQLCPITPHCVSVFFVCVTQNVVQCHPITLNPATCPIATGIACGPVSLACPVQTAACGGLPGGGGGAAGG
jgi:hypothetical protein